MYEYYFTFRSMTLAQTALAVLLGKGLRASLIRTPKHLAVVGCGYAVKLPPGEGYAAASTLHQAQLPFDRCARVYRDGSAEEVRI